MIVVEERLMELFELLPLIDNKKPIYHFGDGIELNKFIIGRKNDTYPLIYQTSLRANINPIRDEADLRPLEFFIATQTEATLYNTERWATSYRNVLQPLYKNIQTLFSVCGIIRTTTDAVWQKEDFPNYSQTESRDQNITVDIIDAIRITLNCTMENTCITKYIKF